MPRGPRLVFGGAPLGTGSFQTLDQVKSLISILRKHEINRIDTAALYPSGNRGRSEGILGEARLAGDLEGFYIDTKILTTSADGSNTLSKAAILESVSQSQRRLTGGNLTELTKSQKESSISTLYCHTFDPVTPLEETTSTLASLHKSGGVFKTLGLSNFTATQIASFIASCEKTSCPTPVVFQGLYNALSRNAELRLPQSPDVPSVLSTLRDHNMSYLVWSPLAGGFLTGKMTRGEHQGTKMAGDQGKFHRMLYDKPSMHQAVTMLEKACAEHYGIMAMNGDSSSSNIPPLAEASLRWLYWHSALGEEDGIILGVPEASMIEANIVAIERGPLSDRLVQAFDEAWAMVRNDAPMF